MKTYVQLSVLAVLMVLSLGCAQNRVVLTPSMHDMTVAAPPWAQANGLPPADGTIYFVGVSQEQATSEALAIEQAHQDALQKVSSYIGLYLGTTDAYTLTTATESTAEWPYRAAYKLNWLLKSPAQISRETEEAQAEAQQAQATGCNWVAQVNIIDTWSVAERFSGPCPKNEMRYGELWKAKVLAAIPQVIIDEMAQYNRDSLRHDQEFARQCMENNIETINYRDQEEWETNHALNLKEREMRLDMQKREFDAYLQYRIAAGKRFLEIERPTFNFMNNTYLYGNAHPFPGEPFTLLSQECGVAPAVVQSPVAPASDNRLLSMGCMPVQGGCPTGNCPAAALPAIAPPAPCSFNAVQVNPATP